MKNPGNASGKNVADFRGLLEALAGQGVEYVLIGGVAAMIHGAARLTLDIDIVYSRSPANLHRLVKALESHRPYLRGAPEWRKELAQLGFEARGCRRQIAIVCLRATVLDPLNLALLFVRVGLRTIPPGRGWMAFSDLLPQPRPARPRPA